MKDSLTDIARTQLSQLVQKETGCHPLAQSEFKPVSNGASGRIIMRGHGYFGIYWTAARADNNSFLPAIKGLSAAGIGVPKLIQEWTDAKGTGACLVEDCGTADILSYKNKEWKLIKQAYRLAFETLLPLYQLKPTWPLQPAFDHELYQWEQAYFAEHFLAQHLKMRDAQDFIKHEAFARMAHQLAALPSVAIHRDCQSQNIMIHHDRAILIDFQGMRMGRMEYDLASLIEDPYMDLKHEQRQELLELWESIHGQAIDRGIYCDCAMQRLMQALGAFANIGYNQHKNWYLNKIPAGIRSLQHILQLAPQGDVAQLLSSCLKNAEDL